MRPWKPQTITVKRDGNYTLDDGRSKVPGAPVTVYSGPADFYIGMEIDETRDEADPGIVTTVIRRIAVYRPYTMTGGATAFLPSKDKVTINGVVYTVKFVREYGDYTDLECWVLD